MKILENILSHISLENYEPQENYYTNQNRKKSKKTMKIHIFSKF